MIPYNTDIHQVIKWEYNKSPNLLSLMDQKSDWYVKYQDDFWTQWQETVFDIDTAGPFGLMVWCIILGVPSGLFSFVTDMRAWAYGKNRQNFVYIDPSSYIDQNAVNTVDPMNIGGVWSDANPADQDGVITTLSFDEIEALVAADDPPAIPDPNLIGGNFIGGGDTRNVPLQEIRWLLKLRYMTLTSDNRMYNTNRMINWIVNQGAPWDYSAKKYFYVADITVVADSSTSNIGSAFNLEYRIGSGLGLSANTILYLSTPEYGFLPAGAGCKYTVVEET